MDRFGLEGHIVKCIRVLERPRCTQALKARTHLIFNKITSNIKKVTHIRGMEADGLGAPVTLDYQGQSSNMLCTVITLN